MAMLSKRIGSVIFWK